MKTIQIFFLGLLLILGMDSHIAFGVSDGDQKNVTLDLLSGMLGDGQETLIGEVKEYTTGGTLILVSDRLLTIPTEIFFKNDKGQFIEEPMSSLAIGTIIQAVISSEEIEGAEVVLAMAILATDSNAEEIDELEPDSFKNKANGNDTLRLENGVWVN